MHVTKKSRLRKALNIRRLRWRLLSALTRAAPILQRRLNFYGAAVQVEAISRAQVFRAERVLEKPLSDEQAAFAKRRCRAFDGAASPDYLTAPARFEQSIHLCDDLVYLGHTGRICSPAARAMIPHGGYATERFLGKPAALTWAAPIDGRALPIVTFRNYFHFLAEAALPLVAYLSEATENERPTIVTSSTQAPFAMRILSLIAEAFSTPLLIIEANEKAHLPQALIYSRRAPSSDWYPVARAEADRFHAMMRAGLGLGAARGRDRRIYFRRPQSKMRNVRNADALEAMLREAGFEIIEPRVENLRDQVALTSEAEIIVSVHGAAMANLLYAPAGATVIEIFSADFAKSLYMVWARMLGLHHLSVDGGVSDQRFNFLVDVAAIRAAIPAAAPIVR